MRGPGGRGGHARVLRSAGYAGGASLGVEQCDGMHRASVHLDRAVSLRSCAERAPSLDTVLRTAAALAALGVGAIAPTCALAGTPPTVTETFSSTGGEQSFTVPAGVSSVRVEAIGAAGETGLAKSSWRNVGGSGADVVGQLPVTAGETLYVEVAAPGFGGAGSEGTVVAAAAMPPICARSRSERLVRRNRGCSSRPAAVAGAACSMGPRAVSAATPATRA